MQNSGTLPTKTIGNHQTAFSRWVNKGNDIQLDRLWGKLPPPDWTHDNFLPPNKIHIITFEVPGAPKQFARDPERVPAVSPVREPNILTADSPEPLTAITVDTSFKGLLLDLTSI